MHTDKRDDSDDVMNTDKIDDLVLRGIRLAVGDVGRGVWKDHLWQRDLAKLMLFADPGSLRNTADWASLGGVDGGLGGLGKFIPLGEWEDLGGGNKDFDREYRRPEHACRRAGGLLCVHPTREGVGG